MEADSHSQPSQVPSRRANFTLLWKIGQNVIDFISVSAASFRGDKFGTLGRGKQERRRAAQATRGAVARRTLVRRTSRMSIFNER